MEFIAVILLVLLLVFFSFNLGAAETAFFSLKSWQFKRLVKKTSNVYLNKLSSNQELISTLTFGSTLINSIIILILVKYIMRLELMYFIVYDFN